MRCYEDKLLYESEEDRLRIRDPNLIYARHVYYKGCFVYYLHLASVEVVIYHRLKTIDCHSAEGGFCLFSRIPKYL